MLCHSIERWGMAGSFGYTVRRDVKEKAIWQQINLSTNAIRALKPKALIFYDLQRILPSCTHQPRPFVSTDNGKGSQGKWRETHKMVGVFKCVETSTIFTIMARRNTFPEFSFLSFCIHVGASNVGARAFFLIAKAKQPYEPRFELTKTQFRSPRSLHTLHLV